MLRSPLASRTVRAGASSAPVQMPFQFSRVPTLQLCVHEWCNPVPQQITFASDFPCIYLARWRVYTLVLDARPCLFSF